MFASEYLDLGFISDYCNYYSRKNPFAEGGLPNSTPVAQLRKEVAPLYMPGKRSLALVSAWGQEQSDLCDSLMYANENDLCFQLYALACHKIKDLVLPVYSRDDLNIEELAILRYFVRLPFAPKILKTEDMDWMLQQHAEALLRNNHDLLRSTAMHSLCAASSSSDLAVYFNRLISCFCKPKSACVRYFNELGFSTEELYRIVSKIPGTSFDYKKEALDLLLSSPDAWTDEQFMDCCTLLMSVIPESGISRYSNYKRMYESGLGRQSNLFLLNKFEFRMEEKMNILTYEEKINVLKRTLIAFPENIKNVPFSLNGILFDVFADYNYYLYPAYCAGRARLKSRAHRAYKQRFLRDQNDLEPFINEIAEDTVDIFLEKMETKAVIKAVYSWCRAHSEAYRLKNYKDIFNKKQQQTINSQCKKLLDDEAPVELQVFSKKFDFDYSELSHHQRSILTEAVAGEGRSWHCTLQKYEILYAVNLAQLESDLCLASIILRSMLKYGVENYDNINHYYVYLRRCECDFCPEIVFNDLFTSITPDSKTGTLIVNHEV